MANPKKIFYIIGAGSAGISLLHDIRARFSRNMVVFLDDDESKAGIIIENTSVMAPISKALEILKPTPHSEVIIAMPSAPAQKIREIFTALKKNNFSQIRILPSPLSYLDRPHLVQTQEIDLADLLPRETITLPNKQTLSYLQNKRILITGAGGTIGSELAVQLLYAGVSRMYLLGHGEHSIYSIYRKLQELQRRGVGEQTNIIPVLCELTDKDAVFHTLEKLRVDVLFHTAAYKHIDLVENNRVISTRVNVFGTRFLLDASQKFKVQRFVLISTDKAVEPSSVYGASKLISEEMTISSATKSMSTLVMRFGNVIGSRGSVVPLFQDQIAMGGPITITSPDCTRYFMTISEACSLILYAMQIESKTPSALYALEMGKQISVLEIAHQMLDFYGLEKNKDIEFEFTGLRDGEKNQEKLLGVGEKKNTSPIKHVYLVTRSTSRSHVTNMKKMLEKLAVVSFKDEVYESSANRKIRYGDKEAIIAIMKEHIASFNPINQARTTRTTF